MSANTMMRPCSGCFEGGEYGQFDAHYAWSDEHRCRIGSGCGECDDIGLVEIRIPTDDEIAEMIEDMQRHDD